MFVSHTNTYNCVSWRRRQRRTLICSRACAALAVTQFFTFCWSFVRCLPCTRIRPVHLAQFAEFTRLKITLLILIQAHLRTLMRACVCVCVVCVCCVRYMKIKNERNKQPNTKKEDKEKRWKKNTQYVRRKTSSECIFNYFLISCSFVRSLARAHTHPCR